MRGRGITRLLPAFGLALLVGCGAKSAFEVEPPAPDLAVPDLAVPDLGPDLSGCVASGPETCDGTDEDCDGLVDEELPLRPVGESLLIRDVDEGDTGDCDTCAWVRDLAAESTSAGILVAWHLGYLGTAPQPNAYVRQLDHDGAPSRPMMRLDDLANGGWMTSTRHRDGMLLTYCGRVGGGDDITMRALLGPSGEPFWEERAQPVRSCGAWSPASVTTGARIVTAWTDNSSGPVAGHEHLVDVAGLDGRSIRSEQVHPEGDGKPGFAVAHGRVVHAVAVRAEPRVSQLRLQSYSLEGEALGEPVRIDALAPETFYGEPWVVPSASGFVIHMDEQSSDPAGRLVLALDTEGRPVGAPRRLDEGLRFINGVEHALPYRRGAVLASPIGDLDGERGYRVHFLDENGEAYGTWDPLEDDRAFGRPVFVEHRGQLFVVYLRGIESRPRALVQIRLWPLACEPS